jgi:hypothetical protein
MRSNFTSGEFSNLILFFIRQIEEIKALNDANKIRRRSVFIIILDIFLVLCCRNVL